jgi:uncharacterized protein YuzE
MKLIHDQAANAAYLYVREPAGDYGPVSTVCLADPEMPGSINLDFGYDEKLVGIEFLAARELLPGSFLQSAT